MDLALSLKARGVKVLLSNSQTEEVRELYREGFIIETVHSRRLVNCQPSGRAAIPELLIQ